MCGPRLPIVLKHSWEYLESVTDSEGNIYFCRPHEVVRLARLKK